METIAPVFLAYFSTALVKGLSGLGFSTICISLLAQFLDMKLAIALVIIPSTVSKALD